MLLARRGLLAGLLATPAIIRTPGLLMPVKSIRVVSTAELGGALNKLSITPQVWDREFFEEYVRQNRFGLIRDGGPLQGAINQGVHRA